ncbi:DUF5683 domain-containing protein [Dyadobacter helix]|uniref:DUF5683 domain-containing protein n=1 Tax=Dyadobacter helix TaxID=2822344 RepID=UPI001BFCD0CC|nr:DUF5683 domain-containing protein [Dyadobacter sp. CECT 9275]
MAHVSRAQVISSDSVKGKPVRVITADSLAGLVPDSVVNLNKAKKFVPVPRTATLLALIPGGGQIYNRDYWKLPIIYLGIGGGLYAFHLNSIKYNDYLSAYKSFYDLNKDSPTYGQVLPGITSDSTRTVRIRNLFATSSEYKQGNLDQVKRGKNYWRRNKNLSIVVAVLIYGLTIIETNVAAHLKTFDLTDDISMHVEPKIQQPMMRQPAPGLKLVFNFK